MASIPPPPRDWLRSALLPITIGAAVAALSVGMGVRALAVLGIPIVFLMLRDPAFGLMVTAASTVTGYMFYIGGTGAMIPISPPKILGAVTLAALVVHTLWFRRRLELGARVLVPLLFLIGSAASLAIEPATEGSMRHAVQLAGSFSFYFLVVNLVDDRGQLHRLLWVLAVAYAVLGLYSHVQYFVPSQWTDEYAIQSGGFYEAFVDRGVQRSSGLSHPGIISFVYTMLIPYVVYLLHHAKERVPRLSLYACLAIAINTVLLTHTRAGFFALGLLAVYYVWKGVIRLTPPLLAGGAVAALLYVGLVLPGSFASRVLSFLDYAQEGSVRIRLENQANAVGFFFDRPFTGIGLGNFEALNPAARPVNLEVTNMLLEVATESGLLGLVPLVAFLWLVLRDARSAERNSPERGAANLGTAAVASVAISLFSSLFMSNQDFREWWLFMAIPVVACSVQLRAQRRAAPEEPAVHARAA